MKKNALPFLLYLLLMVACAQTGGQSETKTPEIAIAMEQANQEQVIGADHPDLRYHGRVAKQGNQVLMAWPGTGVSFQTEATRLTFRLEDRSQGTDDYGQQMNGRYGLYVDGQLHTLWQASADQGTYAVDRLPLNNKTIHLMRLNEPKVSFTVFRGIEADAPIRPSPRAQRHVLWIGDSITAGYGNLPDSANCEFSPQSQHFGHSYAYLIAKRFQADFSVVAWSGRGMTRNYNKSTQGTLPDLYPMAIPVGPELAWADQGEAAPGLVVINVGTNDFAHQSIPDEAHFVATYASLVEQIHRQYPNARFMLIGGAILRDYPKHPAFSTLGSYLKQIASQLQGQGITIATYMMPFFKEAITGCHGHPDREAHKQMAQAFGEAIDRAHPQWE